MTDKLIDRSPKPQIAVVIHPDHASVPSDRHVETRLNEACGLALALDLDVRAALPVRLRKTVPATLFGSGKLDEIYDHIEAHTANVVVIDDQLTPVQQRNLEKSWNVKVIDRTGLILEIFARRARTREGKLQVELARLDYEKSRLVRTWTHLERQRGGAGVMGGPGETQIELDRRLIADKIGKLKTELEDVRRTRALHRQARKRIPYPVVALVGYTNAGKSTLFNTLTRAEVMAKDMLFATLDPTLRTLKLPKGRSAILSDTVGFISDLPHELVAAFRATLEEVQEADLVLHVRDISNPDSEAQARDVEEVLSRLSEGEDRPRRMVEVWNKIDLMSPEDQEVATSIAARSGGSSLYAARMVSAVTGDGIETLLKAIADLIDDAPEAELSLPLADGAALAWLYQNGRVVEHSMDEARNCQRVIVKLDAQALGRFERLFPETERLS